MKTKLTALFTLFVFSLTSTAWAQPVSLARQNSPSPNPRPISIKVSIPNELGTIQDRYQASDSSPFIILIQDAHAIPDAQRSIQKLIGYFQKEYGVSLVALEGASAQLDPQIFRSFPDKELLRKVFQEYQTQGELAGGTRAAVFNETKSVYHGIEDWNLYEKGLALYLEAMKREPEILKELEAKKQRNKEAKKKMYSSKLLEIDSLLEDFHENHANLTGVLKKLATVKEPAPGSELALLLEEVKRNPEAGQPIEREVKKIAPQVKNFLKTNVGAAFMTPHSKGAMNRAPTFGREDLIAFNEKYQDFQTQRISPEAFALFLKELLEKGTGNPSLPVPFSRKLSRLIQNQKRLRDLEGTQFFRDFERYTEEVKAGLFKNEEERKLDQETKRLRLLERLARLELSHRDWSEIRNSIIPSLRAQRNNLPDRFAASLLAMTDEMDSHLAFYETAERRDRAFFKNLNALMKKNARSTIRHPRSTNHALLVAGGFHVEGLTHEFKKHGISYLLLAPHIDSFPKETNYQAHMQGEVSWRDYFEVENGRVSLYKAFVRATRDRLLKQAEGGRWKAEGKTEPHSFGLRPSAFRLLKTWRDQIIRDLADQNKIEKAHEYTRFLDELAPSSLRAKRSNLLVKVERFIRDLTRLQAQNQLTQENVLKLLQPATTQSLAGPAVLASGERTLPDLLGLQVKGGDGTAQEQEKGRRLRAEKRGKISSALGRRPSTFDLSSRAEVRAMAQEGGEEASRKVDVTLSLGEDELLSLKLSGIVAEKVSNPALSWNRHSDESAREVEEIIRKWNEFKERSSDSFDFFKKSQPLYETPRPGFAFWVLENFSNLQLTQEKAELLRYLILRHFHDLLAWPYLGELFMGSVLEGSLDIRLPKEKKDEYILDTVWYLLLRLFVIERRLETQSAADETLHQAHLDLIHDFYRLIFGHLEGLDSAKAFYESRFFRELPNTAQQKLGRQITSLFQNWDEWGKESRELVDWLDSFEYTVFPEDSEEDSDAESPLFTHLSRLRSALTPRTETAIEAWDYPLRYLTEGAGKGALTFFLSYITPMSRKGDELSNYNLFQLDWLEAMAKSGFKNWAFDSADAFSIVPIKQWLEKEEDFRSVSELLTLLQDYLNLKKGTGVASLRSFLILPKVEGSPFVTSWLRYWEAIFELKLATGVESITLFDGGISAKEGKTLQDWIKETADRKRLVLGDVHDPKIRTDYKDSAFFITHRKARPDYEHKGFSIYHALPYVVHLIGESRGWGDRKSAAIPIRDNQALLGLFEEGGPWLGHDVIQPHFYLTFNIEGRVWNNTLIHAVIISSDEDEEDQEEPWSPEGVHEEKPEPVTGARIGASRAEVRANVAGSWTLEGGRRKFSGVYRQPSSIYRSTRRSEVRSASPRFAEASQASPKLEERRRAEVRSDENQKVQQMLPSLLALRQQGVNVREIISRFYQYPWLIPGLFSIRWLTDIENLRKERRIIGLIQSFGENVQDKNLMGILYREIQKIEEQEKVDFIINKLTEMKHRLENDPNVIRIMKEPLSQVEIPVIYEAHRILREAMEEFERSIPYGTRNALSEENFLVREIFRQVEEFFSKIGALFREIRSRRAQAQEARMKTFQREIEQLEAWLQRLKPEDRTEKTKNLLYVLGSEISAKTGEPWNWKKKQFILLDFTKEMYQQTLRELREAVGQEVTENLPLMSALRHFLVRRAELRELRKLEEREGEGGRNKEEFIHAIDSSLRASRFGLPAGAEGASPRAEVRARKPEARRGKKEREANEREGYQDAISAGEFKGMAGRSELRYKDLRGHERVPQRRAVRFDGANETLSGVHSLKHSRGEREGTLEGVRSVPLRGQRFSPGINDFNPRRKESEIPLKRDHPGTLERLERNHSHAQRPHQDPPVSLSSSSLSSGFKLLASPSRAEVRHKARRISAVSFEGVPMARQEVWRAGVRKISEKELKNGKLSDTDAGIFDNRNRRGDVGLGMGSEEDFQPLLEEGRARIAHPEQDDTGTIRPSQGQDARKIQIHRKKNPALLGSTPQEINILRLRQTDFAGMNHIEIKTPQPPGRPLRDGHIQEELQGKDLSGEGKRLFAGQVGPILERLPEVLKGEVGIVGKNLIRGLSGSQEVEKQMDGDSQSTNASLSIQYGRISGDAPELFHGENKLTTSPSTRQFTPRAEVRARESVKLKAGRRKGGSKSEESVSPSPSSRFKPLASLSRSEARRGAREAARKVAGILLDSEEKSWAELRTVSEEVIETLQIKRIPVREFGKLLRSEAREFLREQNRLDPLGEEAASERIQKSQAFLETVLAWSERVTGRLQGDIALVMNMREENSAQEAFGRFTTQGGKVYVILPQALRGVLSRQENVQLLFASQDGKAPKVSTAWNSGWMPVAEAGETGLESVWNPALHFLRIAGQGRLDWLDESFQSRAEAVILGTIAIAMAGTFKKYPDLNRPEVQAELLKALLFEGIEGKAFNFGKDLMTIHLDHFAGLLQAELLARAEIRKAA